ncbi:MAG: hypothetical protein JOZ41_17840, partial [Chloroflexi bacterium]|nr:hypothetical protein [Chloroflexota bacterium]
LANGSSRTLTTSATANGSGQFSVSLGIPGDVAGGSFTVVARSAASGRAPTARLTVAKLAPSVVAVPTTAAPGTPVTVNGFGFASGATVTLTLQGQRVGSATADASGKFSTKFTVPSGLATGSYTITATSSNGRTARIALAVNRQVATHYYFAAFYTGRGYHEYLTFLNPSAIQARVTITYQLTTGRNHAKALTLAAHTRATEDVNADLGYHVSSGAVVAADVPIAVARVVFHNSDMAIVPGATSPATAWYFADGNTSKNYREFLAIENPNSGAVQVAVHFLPTHHPAFTIYRTVPAATRTTVKVNSFVHKDAVGVTVTASGPIVVNRSIFIHHGTTSKIGVTAPQRTWYFAAGPANGAAHNWIGAINPTGQRAYVTLHAYGPQGSEIGTVSGWLRPYARVGYLINRIAGQPDAAVVLTSSAPIVAEETTYVARMHDASTDTFGAASPGKSWAFAAVNTGGGQSDVLSLFNPSLNPIPVVVQFITASGGVTQRTYVVAPLAHVRVDVGSVVPNAQLGIVAASNDPFVALNRAFANNGLASDTSIGIPM